jgi:hypothetical protein
MPPSRVVTRGHGGRLLRQLMVNQRLLIDSRYNTTCTSQRPDVNRIAPFARKASSYLYSTRRRDLTIKSTMILCQSHDFMFYFQTNLESFLSLYISSFVCKCRFHQSSSSAHSSWYSTRMQKWANDLSYSIFIPGTMSVLLTRLGLSPLLILHESATRIVLFKISGF